MRVTLEVAAVLVVMCVPLALLARVLRSRRAFGTTAQRAAYEALHEASLATPHLRGGLTPASAARAASHLRSLLDVAALAILDTDALLHWDGHGAQHSRTVARLARPTLTSGRTHVVQGPDLDCGVLNCPLRQAVVTALTVDDRVVGALAAFTGEATPGLVRACGEVARWVSGQLSLAELDLSRQRLAEAEVRALRAQISPHFIYNALTAIASFVRTDPARARELLLEFADFTRYSFRRHGDFTSLAEELRSIDRYLLLERARFGDRLEVSLRIAPEVLPVAVPFLCLQPLVENAVRHGLQGRDGRGRITIVATDAGAECQISVEDDGAGMDPERLARTLAGDSDSDSTGLANVDLRMRSVFGDDYGLVVETALGAGTKVSMRVPKYHTGVRAS
jgi:two-component system LytT family sensor kinase